MLKRKKKRSEKVLQTYELSESRGVSLHFLHLFESEIEMYAAFARRRERYN